MSLPADRARYATGAATTVHSKFDVDVEASARFAETCKSAQVSVFMGTLAMLGLLLRRWCAADDVVVLTPTSTRVRADLGPLAGRFGNIVPLALSLAGDPTIAEVLTRARVAALAGYAHAAVPASLVYDTADAFGHPLARVALNMPFDETTPDESTTLKLGDADVLVEEVFPRRPVMWSRADLVAIMWRHDNHITIRLVGSADLFERSTIERCVNALGHLFQTVRLDTRISGLSWPEGW
jgi:non-ribosomal peptide synthetase component F